MSYMNDDTDPFGMPYAPIRKQKPIKEIKEESTERFTYDGCIVYDKEETDDHRCKYGMDMPDTVRLLNQLSDENEQLKQNIGIILKYCREKGKYAMDMKETKAHNVLQRILNDGDVE